MSSNISSEGIFIRNFSPPPVGTQVKICVNLSNKLGGVPIKIVGKVVRVAADVGVEERGMGVEFTSIYSDSPEAIRHFIWEVYEVEHCGKVSLEPDTGGYRFDSRPEKVLPIRNAKSLSGSPVSFSKRQLLMSLLLIFVGIIIGSGFVLLFFSIK
jgi:hypothetical protein